MIQRIGTGIVDDEDVVAVAHLAQHHDDGGDARAEEDVRSLSRSLSKKK